MQNDKIMFCAGDGYSSLNGNNIQVDCIEVWCNLYLTNNELGLTNTLKK